MRILITGSTGNIGEYLAPYLASSHNIIATGTSEDKLKLHDKVANLKTKVLDITDKEQCETVIRDVDVVIHLAADSSVDATFESTVELNIEGLHNVLDSAQKNGVKRFIFASSIHSVDGYPPDKQIETYEIYRPDNIYGASKVYGEALCSYYAYYKDIEAIAIRIAAFNGLKADDDVVDVSPRNLSAFLHEDDFGAQIDKCLTIEMKEPYYLLNGLSDNTFKRLSMERTKVLLDGFEPKEDAFEETFIELEKSLDEEEVDEDISNP